MPIRPDAGRDGGRDGPRDGSGSGHAVSGRLVAHLRRRRGWRANATALGFGVLAAGALPPFHLVALLWLAIPGLLLLVAAAPDWRAAGWRAFSFGIGHHVAGLFWITEALLIEAERAGFLIPPPRCRRSSPPPASPPSWPRPACLACWPSPAPGAWARSRGPMC
jgi:hypothetical protein